MREYHPYGEFIPKLPRAMIIGSFPIGKFSHPQRRSEILPHEKDFFFGGEKNLLWRLLGDVFNYPVETESQIKKLLEDKGLAVGDVIRSCVRRNGGGSDSDLHSIEWNMDLINVIGKNGIKKLYFTSSKVESWFNKLFPGDNGFIKVTLISPSAQSFRSLYHHKNYLTWLSKNAAAPKYEFILQDYRQKFETIL